MLEIICFAIDPSLLTISRWVILLRDQIESAQRGFHPFSPLLFPRPSCQPIVWESTGPILLSFDGRRGLLYKTLRTAFVEGDRRGGVIDPFGHIWWIATHINFFKNPSGRNL